MNNTFGLDIGSSTMKAVYLKENNGQTYFKSSIIAKTPSAGIISESSLDQKELAQNIRQMVIDAKIPSRSANLSISDNHAYAKVIDMPLLTEKELTKAIQWEAEQHIPVPLSSISLDWTILRDDIQDASGRKMQVLLVGAPITILKKYEKVFEYAGINIAGLETEMLSVLRSTVITESSPNSLVINIGSIGTSLAIIQKGVLVFLYNIPLGGLAMNRSIATEFGFSASQAEEYKKVYGLDESNFGGKIRVAIEPILMSMITEIKKALSFYADKYKDEHPVKQIILTGGTARLPGIVSVFVAQTGIETVIANPWKSLGIQDVPADLTESGPEYAIALGLAVK